MKWGAEMKNNSGKVKREGLKTATECIDNSKKPNMKDFVASCAIPTVVICRTNGAVEAVNDAFLRLTRLSASDIPDVAAMAKRFVHGNESASRLQTLVSADSICSDTINIVPAEGGTVSATAHVSPLLSGMEMTDYSVMQITNVNRTPDADDYRILFDNVPISIWKYDFSETLELRKEIEAVGAIDFKDYFSKHPELFRRVIESLKVIDVNEETLKLYGASSKDELLGYLGGNTLPESAESIVNAITAYLNGERYYECETVNKTLDGRLLHIIHRITFPENNRLSKTALATVINISSRKQAEYDLIDSETKYHTTLDAIADPIVLTDRSYTILMANQSCIECCKRRGMSPDIIGKNLFDMFPFLTQKSREEYEYAFSTGEIVEREEHVVFDGNEHVAETRKIPISSDGADSRMLTVIHYVTERKRMERALRESEERYRLMFDVIPAAVFEYDFSEALGEIDRLREMECTDYRRFLDEHLDVLMTLIGKIRLADINQETLLLYNAPTKKAFFESFGKQSTPEAILTFRNAIDAYLHGHTSYTTETVNKTIDGSIINILYKVTFPEDRKLLSRAIVTVIDITKRKAIEEKLRQQSEAMEASADGIAIMDANGDYIHMNESYVRMYGYDSKRELVGKNWNIHYSPDEYNHIVDGLTGSARGEKQWRGEAVGIRRDGGTFPQEASLTTIEGGGLICVIRDITERKKSERALKDSEERFRLIADLSPFPISFIGEDGRYLYVNDRFTEVFGYTIEDIPSGQDWFRLAFPNASQREKIIET